MRAMQARGFSGYEDLALRDLPKPRAEPGGALVRVTAAGVTPLDHTILTGHFPLARAPLTLGNEGAGVVEDGGDTGLSSGTRVMFTGPYGVLENGAFCEWLAVKREHLFPIPTSVGDVEAAGVPVAYLTAYMALQSAGMAVGKSVFAPAIGGSVGNAVTQLARALGARHTVSTTTSTAKASTAREHGFDEVIDLGEETVSDGVRRLTQGYGADIVIDAVGGALLSESLSILANGGSLTTLGYAAGRESTIDVTHLIWKGASIRSFMLFAEPPAAWEHAWHAVGALLASGHVRPIVAKVYALEDAAEAIRYLVEDRPFGRVVLEI